MTEGIEEKYPDYSVSVDHHQVYCKDVGDYITHFTLILNPYHTNKGAIVTRDCTLSGCVSLMDKHLKDLKNDTI